MKKQQNIVRTILGALVALIALTSAVSAQVTNGWITHGPNLATSSLAIDPGNPSTIYAGTRGGVFKSTDGGATWSNIGLSNTTTLAIDFVNPNILYAGTFSSDVVFHPGGAFLFKSTDGGATWSNSSSPIDFDIALLVMDPSSSNTLYAGSAGEAAGAGGIILWKSTDAGATWSGGFTGNIGLYSWGLAINPVNSQILYAPGDLWSTDRIPQVIDSGLFKSMDGGANWSATGLTNTFVQAVAIDPVNPNTLYAGTIDYGVANTPFRGLLKSTDAGASWFPINNGLSDLLSARSAVTAILVDHDNPNIVYAGTSGSGVFKTTDGGANWSPFNKGLTNLNIRALALAPGNSNALYAGTSGGVFKIVESKASPATNPIDDAQTFVHQQYLDFLNREPDTDGLAYWTNQIAQCGSDIRCIHGRRIGVSAAFFVEQEFQRTGYVVYRAYRAAYGTMPNAPSRANITFAQFMTDRAQLVGGPDLQQSTINFANNFVLRPEFKQVYPDSMSQPDFVNALFNTANLYSSPQQRQDEIDAVMNGSKTRAQVLLDVIDIREFKDREYNPAFMLMQYFGYLRRDVDQGGYDFWLDVVNNREPNNYRGMVCAFITSTEYQLRFGSVVTRSNADCGR